MLGAERGDVGAVPGAERGDVGAVSGVSGISAPVHARKVPAYTNA